MKHFTTHLRRSNIIFIIPLITFTLTSCTSGLNITSSPSPTPTTNLFGSVTPSKTPNLIFPPTLTPTFFTATITQTITVTPGGQPFLTVHHDTLCFQGPGEAYVVVGALFSGTKARVLGQSAAAYWIIEFPSRPREHCWVSFNVTKADQTARALPFYPIPPTPSPTETPSNTHTKKPKAAKTNTTPSPSPANKTVIIEISLPADGVKISSPDQCVQPYLVNVADLDGIDQVSLVYIINNRKPKSINFPLQNSKPTRADYSLTISLPAKEGNQISWYIQTKDTTGYKTKYPDPGTWMIDLKGTSCK